MCVCVCLLLDSLLQGVVLLVVPWLLPYGILEGFLGSFYEEDRVDDDAEPAGDCPHSLMVLSANNNNNNNNNNILPSDGPLSSP